MERLTDEVLSNLEATPYWLGKVVPASRELLCLMASELRILREGNRRLERDLGLLEWENDQLRDHPENDDTDHAHPAWLRGRDHGISILCQRINKILDGERVYGIMEEPWKSVCHRLEKLEGVLNAKKCD